MRFVLPCLSLAALALAGCAVQTPQEQLAPSSPTVRLCEGKADSNPKCNTHGFNE